MEKTQHKCYACDHNKASVLVTAEMFAPSESRPLRILQVFLEGSVDLKFDPGFIN